MQLTLKRAVYILLTVQVNLYFAETNNVFKFNQDWIILFQIHFSHHIFFFTFFLSF